jgi:hypothetical protein
VRSAASWRDRERLLTEAAAALGRRTDDLGLAPAVGAAPRQFYDRDVRVVGAEEFTVALTAEITDPVLRDRLGRRHGRIPRLPGTIDQAIDSADVLTNPDRFRACGAALGLTDRA